MRRAVAVVKTEQPLIDSKRRGTMLAVLPIIVCCALVSLVLGVVAVLGLSKRDKKPADQEETNRRLSDWRES